jgi:ABC-type dipeptide/oligopeptide/nickel transport system ATPase subunit
LITALGGVDRTDGSTFTRSTIEEGEAVGLLGESGCGKSTLVRLLARLTDPNEGIISLNGRDIGVVPARKFGSAPERSQIQVVFQDATESINPRF